MSAYLVASHHIAYLAQFAAKDPHNKSRHGDAVAIAEKLARANCVSLAHRYGDAIDQGFIDDCKADAAELYWSHVDPFEIIAAADCFDYQACEVKDWESTDVARLVRHIKDQAITIARAGRDVKWGAPEPDGRRTRRKPAPMPIQTAAEYRRHGLYMIDGGRQS